MVIPHRPPGVASQHSNASFFGTATNIKTSTINPTHKGRNALEVDLERLEDLVADGLLPPEICTELGISQSDFHTEKCISPEFDAALKRGKERAKQAKAQEKKTRAETHGHHWTPQRLEPVSAEVIGPFGQPGDIIRQVLNDTIEDPAQVAQGLSLYGCSAQQIWDLVGEGTSEHEMSGPRPLYRT